VRTNITRRRAATDGAALTANEVTVAARPAEDRIVVEVSGRLTVDSSFRLRPVLHGAVGAAPGAGVVVDFAKTTYIDTSAAATLIEAAMLARERSVHLRIVGLRGQPRLLTEIIELDRIFRALGSGYEVVFA
jgi:anti-anti-sigma factor